MALHFFRILATTRTFAACNYTPILLLTLLPARAAANFLKQQKPIFRVAFTALFGRLKACRGHPFFLKKAQVVTYMMLTDRLL